MRRDGAATENYSLQCNVNEKEVSSTVSTVSKNWTVTLTNMSVNYVVCRYVVPFLDTATYW